MRDQQSPHGNADKYESESPFYDGATQSQDPDAFGVTEFFSHNNIVCTDINHSFPYPVTNVPTFINTVEYLQGPTRGGYQYKRIFGKCHAVPNRLASIG
jgi:hypothetical protein